MVHGLSSSCLVLTPLLLIYRLDLCCPGAGLCRHDIAVDCMLADAWLTCHGSQLRLCWGHWCMHASHVSSITGRRRAQHQWLAGTKQPGFQLGLLQPVSVLC